MGKLLSSLLAVLPPGLQVPDPLAKLYARQEELGRVGETRDGQVVSNLNGDTDVGTELVFTAAVTPTHYERWFGSEDPEIRARLCIFARTGGDGSRAGLWRDDAGATKIVHLGSGSGSTLVCQLGDAPVDFLRLAAIGYAELCWDSDWDEPPPPFKEFDEDDDEAEVLVKPDLDFQRWVTETFGATIPRTGAEVVPRRCHMHDTEPADPFARWVLKMTGRSP